MKRFLLICSIVVFFPACQQYVVWGKKTFKQADEVCYSVDKARAEVQTQELLFDVFSTLDVINAMPRTDVVVEAHERLRAECAGESALQTAEKIGELQELNKQETVVFVALYGDKKDWNFSLYKNGAAYEAREIKRASIDRWYKVILGKQVTRFKKNIYRVTFDVPISKPFEFRVCNGEHAATFSWN